jgi:hypothetical protein
MELSELDPKTASHDVLHAAVVRDLSSRMTGESLRRVSAQRYLHPTRALRAEVIALQALEGVASKDRNAVWRQLEDSGQIRWEGSRALGFWAADA